MQVVSYLIIITTFFVTTNAWDSEQLEVFDVVEEVKQNFYELLNVSKDADSKEIRTAFRILSLKLHPDKNLEEDTSEQFRNLVSVYDTLRSPTKRRYYDDVLVNGLPNWRSAVFYYRHVRRLGLFEACIILTVIISIGQYLVSWASYAEKKYTFEQFMSRKKKDRDLYTFDTPKPSLLNTLPIQIPKLIWWIITGLPRAFMELKNFTVERVEEITAKPTPVVEEQPLKPPKPTRKRKPAFVPPEGPNFEMASTSTTKIEREHEPPPVSGGLWTDDDLNELVQLVKKYPGGTLKRWELIAEELNRSVAEVTFMANKMKSGNFRVGNEEEDEEVVVQPKVKQKTRAKVDDNAGEKKWSQEQQKALEDGLSCYPKGCVDRWDRIAECVPGMSKEDCMLRYRSLVEAVKKQKEVSSE